MKYAGLIDDPQERMQAHGNPADWQHQSFSAETEARQWEKGMLARPDYRGGPGGAGWRYGYLLGYRCLDCLSLSSSCLPSSR